MAVEITRPGKEPRPVIFDTSPLITLCAFSIQERPILEYVLPFLRLRVVDTVARESTANPVYPDAAVIADFLQSGHIERVPTPQTIDDALIDAYTRLGQGERDTIRLGLTLPENDIVLDDHLAFVVATRFGLRPMLLLDLLTLLVRENGLSKALAQDIVRQTASRYSSPFVEHTQQKLEGRPA